MILTGGGAGRVIYVKLASHPRGVPTSQGAPCYWNLDRIPAVLSLEKENLPLSLKSQVPFSQTSIETNLSEKVQAWIVNFTNFTCQHPRLSDRTVHQIFFQEALILILCKKLAGIAVESRRRLFSLSQEQQANRKRERLPFIIRYPVIHIYLWWPFDKREEIYAIGFRKEKQATSRDSQQFSNEFFTKSPFRLTFTKISKFWLNNKQTLSKSPLPSPLFPFVSLSLYFSRGQNTENNVPRSLLPIPHGKRLLPELKWQ